MCHSCPQSMASSDRTKKIYAMWFKDVKVVLGVGARREELEMFWGFEATLLSLIISQRCLQNVTSRHCSTQEISSGSKWKANAKTTTVTQNNFTDDVTRLASTMPRLRIAHICLLMIYRPELCAWAFILQTNPIYCISTFERGLGLENKTNKKNRNLPKVS